MSILLSLGELGIGHQQLSRLPRPVERHRVLIMDEPTSALSQSEVKVLFKVIAQLKRRGVTIIYISHRLEEQWRLATTSIFRDGRFIQRASRQRRRRTVDHRQMVGDKYFDYQPAPRRRSA